MPVKVHESAARKSATHRSMSPPSSRATPQPSCRMWKDGFLRFNVNSGDLVKKGQTLMEIDPRRQAATVSNWEAQRASKVANLQLAKVQLERAEGLLASGVISKQDFDQANPPTTPRTPM